MAELADALDLGSSIERCAGSIPVRCTKNKSQPLGWLLFFMLLTESLHLKCPSFYKRLATECGLLSDFEPIAMQHSFPVRCTTSEQALFRLLRFLCKNQSALTPLFLLSAKSHARLTCSVVNALATVLPRYHLFAGGKSSSAYYAGHLFCYLLAKRTCFGKCVFQQNPPLRVRGNTASLCETPAGVGGFHFTELYGITRRRG